jgi:predicted dehydrogenase
MFDKEGRNIDAVIVATPDHMHGTASMWAMERGKHVYCQKPLTRTIWEARELSKAAGKYNVATQMGNQGYSNEGTRQCAEMIWNGDIGPVTEVHAWTNRPIWPQGLQTPPKEEPAPPTMDWDTWIGNANERPYSSEIAPFKWRGYYDYGCGALGDMACHILGAPNLALMLGAPSSVECTKQVGRSEFTFPLASVIRFDFPARGSMPPVKVFWYDGVKAEIPRPDGVPKDELLGDRGNNGSLFIGEKGMLTTGCYGERTRLVPAARMADYKMPPPFLTRSPGHYRDWIRACKGGAPACSNFSIAGPFTEWILLGVLSLRFEGKLEWDSAKMRVTNNKEANKLVKPKFHNGWKFA